MRRLLTLALALTASVSWAQIQRTTIERTTISAASTSDDGPTCATSSRTFNGTDQYFTATSDVGATSAFTAACWFYVENTTATKTLVAEDDSSGGKRDWNLLTTTKLQVTAFTGGSVKTAIVAAPLLTTYAWHLGAFAYNGVSTIRVSLDGAAYTSTDMGGALDNDGPGLSVAAAHNGSLPFGGRIGACASWGSELTAGAASTLLAIYSGTVTSCSDLETTYSAAHCWPMDGDAGANEEDAVGTVDLTQVNSPGSADGPGEGCE
jgi:hypothetical protein